MGVIDTFKTHGTATTLSYAALRASGHIPGVRYHRYHLLAVPRSGMPKMPRGYSVCEMSEAALQIHSIDAPEAVRAARFEQGLTCLGAFDDDGELVGVNWLKTGSFDEDEVFVRYHLPAGVAWDTGLWIVPARRMSRAFAALWAGSAAWLAQAECEWSVSRIADYNLSSINAHLRMQAVDCGRLTVLQLGALQIALGAQPALGTIRRSAPPGIAIRIPA